MKIFSKILVSERRVFTEAVAVDSAVPPSRVNTVLLILVVADRPIKIKHIIA